MCVTAYGHPLEPIDLPPPEVAPGHALVEILACGVCFSDVKTIRGHMPFSPALPLPHVPGHEIAGRIVEVNGDSTVAPGERVVVHHVWACGRCAACRRGDENLCRDYDAWVGFTEPGGFQEYLSVPVERLLRVPDTIPTLDLPVLTCAMGTAYRAVVTRGAARAGEDVVVLGLGGVGIHAAQIAASCGARVLGIDVDDLKLAVARSLGIEVALASDVEEATRSFFEGAGADAIIETTGIPTQLELGRRIGRPGSRIVAVGYRSGAEAAIASDHLALWEYTVLGSRYAIRAEIERGIRLVAEGAVRLIVDEVLKLEDANDAVERLERGEVVGRLVLQIN
jgi:alcohol dehydrogenase